MFLSEKTIEAWRLITKGLRGGHDLERIAQDVLDGRMKFVGNETDGINAVPDTDPETEQYREQVRYIFAGRCRLGNTWWRPRAKVETFGPEDAHWAMEHGARLASPFDGSGAAERFYKKRVEFYGRDGERSGAFHVPLCDGCLVHPYQAGLDPIMGGAVTEPAKWVYDRLEEDRVERSKKS